VLAVWLGGALLSFFGISIPAFRIAGSLPDEIPFSLAIVGVAAIMWMVLRLAEPIGEHLAVMGCWSYSPVCLIEGILTNHLCRYG
jgi:small neutral amino acid transporter SnatA (MarC family)